MPPCQHCEKTFADLSSLRRHVQRLHPDKNTRISKTTFHQCAICQTTFTRAESLRRHTRKHQEAPTRCEICSRSFTRDDYCGIHQTKCARKFLAQACERLEDHLCPGSYTADKSAFGRLRPETSGNVGRHESDNGVSQSADGSSSSIHFTHEYVLDVDTAGRALRHILSHALNKKSSDDFEEGLVFAFRLDIDLDSIPGLDALANRERAAFPTREFTWTNVLLNHHMNEDVYDTLLYACNSGFCCLVEPLMWRGADINHEGFGETALSSAVYEGQFDTARFLLVLGADPDLGLPINEAVAQGRTNIVTLLVGYGASLQIDDGLAWESPLELAIYRDKLDMVNCLLSLGADVNLGEALRTAVYANRREIAEALVRHGADIDRISDYWKKLPTSLCKAVSMSRKGAVELALSLKADPNIGNPLKLAIEKGNLEIAQLLVEHGADVSLKMDYLRTPLHVAAANAHLGLLEATLAQNSSPDYTSALNVHGNNALYYAAWSLQSFPPCTVLPVVAKLIEAGANAKTIVNRAEWGSHLIILASETDPDNASIVTLLLQLAASSPPAHPWLFDALVVAVQLSSAQVVRALVEAGAKDEEGKCRALASRRGNVEIIGILQNR